MSGQKCDENASLLFWIKIEIVGVWLPGVDFRTELKHFFNREMQNLAPLPILPQIKEREELFELLKAILFSVVVTPSKKIYRTLINLKFKIHSFV